MDPRTQAKVEARAQVIKAMSHSPRLFIVEQLSQGERCVCEITECG